MFKKELKVMFMTIAKIKTETHFQQYSKNCNKLMSDYCFKAEKEFDKAKQEFVKFPDNMCSEIIFMNIKNSIRQHFAHQKKPVKNINGAFTRLLTSEINKRIIRSSGQLSNLYTEILLAISQTVITQTYGNLSFKSHYCDVIDNSQIF